MNEHSTSHSRLPSWAHEPLIALTDGPMAGQWFTATDWHERLAAARRMVALQQRPAAALSYVDTGRTIPHPHVPEAAGDVWTCTPASSDDDTGEDIALDDPSLDVVLDDGDEEWHW